MPSSDRKASRRRRSIPANLRGAPWFKNPIIKDGFWLPSSRAMGVAGLAHLVALHVAQANSLSAFIAGSPGVYAGFAPGADGNKPLIYIANVMEWANIPDQDIALFNYIL